MQWYKFASIKEYPKLQILSYGNSGTKILIDGIPYFCDAIPESLIRSLDQWISNGNLSKSFSLIKRLNCIRDPRYKIKENISPNTGNQLRLFDAV